MGPQLFTVTMFFGSHVLQMKAEHYTSSLQPSCLLPTIVWHFGSELNQKQLRIQSSLSFNGGARCKVLDHLHLCRVCLQLYIPPSDVIRHSTQLPLHMNLSIVQLLCLYMHVYLFVSISCSDFLSVLSFFIYNNVYIYIHLYIYIYTCISYMPMSVYYFLYLSGTRTCSAPILFTAVPVSLHIAAVSLHCCKKGSGDMRMLSTSLHVSKFSSPISTFMWPLAFVHPPWASSRVHSVQSDTRRLAKNRSPGSVLHLIYIFCNILYPDFGWLEEFIAHAW